MTAVDSHQPRRIRNRKPEFRRVEIPESLSDLIEIQREKLAKAGSLLRCLTNALEADTELLSGPYYPDISRLACRLVRRAFNGLDSVNLNAPGVSAKNMNLERRRGSAKRWRQRSR